MSAPTKFSRDSFDAAEFFAAVHGAMAYRKVNAKQLSEATGISESTLSRMWFGTRVCDAASLAALSAWAGINPANYCAPTKVGVEPDLPGLIEASKAMRPSTCGLDWSAGFVSGADYQRTKVESAMEPVAAWRCIKPHCPTNCDSCRHAIRNEPGARLLIVEMLDAFANDGHGAPFEDGECAIVDKARAFVCAPEEAIAPLPPAALAAARAFGAGLDEKSLEQPSEVL